MSLRPTLDFLLYDWLKVPELQQRERFARAHLQINAFKNINFRLPRPEGEGDIAGFHHNMGGNGVGLRRHKGAFR